MSDNRGIKQKFLDFIGMDDEEEEDDLFKDADLPAVQEAPPEPSDVRVILTDPTDFSEAPLIVRQLKQGNTLIVNLKQAEYDEGRKIFDFLSGAVFALEGSLNRAAESVFILAPAGIGVDTHVTMNDTAPDLVEWED